MEKIIGRIQAVINTLDQLDIVSKRDTMLKIIGCQNVLAEVQDALKKQEVDPDGGDDHAE